MSKLSRTVLKEIVKECVYEILEETFSRNVQVSNSQMNENIKRAQTRQQAQQKSTGTRSHLDNITYGSNSNTVKNKNFEQRVNEVTSALTSDPVMSSIFQDTARTTLQNQSNADINKPGAMSAGDAAAMKVKQSDPRELFAESADKWANLAFGN